MFTLGKLNISTARRRPPTLFLACVHSKSCPRLCDGQAPLSTAWDSPGKNTEVSCRALLQGIFLTQGSHPHLYVSCIVRQVLYH